MPCMQILNRVGSLGQVVHSAACIACTAGSTMGFGCMVCAVQDPCNRASDKLAPVCATHEPETDNTPTKGHMQAELHEQQPMQPCSLTLPRQVQRQCSHMVAGIFTCSAGASLRQLANAAASVAYLGGLSPDVTSEYHPPK